jgi:hypothetical protein
LCRTVLPDFLVIVSAQVPASTATKWLFDLKPLRGPVLTVAADDPSLARRHLIDYLLAVGIVAIAADAEALLDEAEAEAATVLLP